MAYTNSDLATAQAKLSAQFATSELRAPSNATFQAYVKNAQAMLPNYQELKTRDDRAINTYYINRASRAAGTARAHNHTGTQGTSGVLTPSWATHSDKFSISAKQGDKNIFSRIEMLVAEVKNAYLNLTTDLEGFAVSHLFANRSGVNAGDGVEGTFNATQNAFEVDSSSNGDRFMQIINSNMEINNYRQGMTYFCDTVAYNRFLFQSAQGVQNATNLSFQFQGNTFVHSVGLHAKAAALGVPYAKGFVIAVPDGTIAGLPWIPIQNRNGLDTKVASFSSAICPFDNLDYAVHMYEVSKDGTATGGFTQDVAQEFEFSIDVAFDHAPLSNAGETTLQAFALI